MPRILLDIFRGNYWLDSPSFGFRKILLVYFFLLSFFILSLYYKDFLLTLLIIILISFFTSYLIEGFLSKGYLHRLEVFTSLEKKMEIRDHIFPLDKKKNTRALALKEKAGIYSRIFLNQKSNNSCAAYDYCRIFTQLYPICVKRALVLGAGGLSVPIFLARRYLRAEVNVVEIDPKIISIAQKYFLPKRNRRIKLVNQDALRFVGEDSLKYQFIFSNLYLGSNLSEVYLRLSFLKNLKKLMDEKGFLIVNITSAKTRLQKILFGKFSQVFQTVTLHVFGKSTVLFIPGEKLEINPLSKLKAEIL